VLRKKCRWRDLNSRPLRIPARLDNHRHSCLIAHII